MSRSRSMNPLVQPLAAILNNIQCNTLISCLKDGSLWYLVSKPPGSRSMRIDESLLLPHYRNTNRYYMAKTCLSGTSEVSQCIREIGCGVSA